MDGERRLRLPDWPPQDWRAWAALVSTVLGGVALTVFAAWLVWIIAFAPWADTTQPQRLKYLGYALFMLLLGIIAIMLSHGLAINRRKISVTRAGIEIEGGGGPAGQAIDKASAAASNLPPRQPEQEMIP